MKKMNPVVHFEIPYKNSKRISKFYSSAFGWQTQALGVEMGNYVLATTTESEAAGKTSARPKTPGTINGGFFQKIEDTPAQFPSVVISVDNIQQAIAKIKEAGGEVLGEPMEIPGVGTYVSFLDSEGNRISMMQLLMK
jgi:predicted enzyme related to lactoylglutathione lyase